MSLITPPATSSAPGPRSEERCRILEWDSNFFGFRIGRLFGSHLSPDDAGQAVQWCREQGVKCLYFLAGAEDSATSLAAENAGFRLVDIRCTYTYNLSTRRPLAATPAIRPFEPSDLPHLQQIASSSHGSSRFYYDRRFDRKRSSDLYAAWIERSCRGWADAVYVAGFTGLPAGYVTCHLDAHKAGSIGLIAVDPQFQGRGLGQQLTCAAISHLSRRGARRVDVVTQGRNIRSQQMYQRCGFVISTVEIWYHLWL
jgi:dTDP-4-amino-4,6-dideoxy-D-galactose acyltransferase